MTGRKRSARCPLVKVPTGVSGLDEVLEGGLPGGRASLVCGGPGCGKTLLALEFVLGGARDFGEPGVVIAFEETEAELAANVASLGFDLDALVASNLVAVDHVDLSGVDIEETGEYDLEALLLRVGYAIDLIGAKRVAIDTIESLFSSFADETTIRSELRRLLRGLKDRQVTVLITGERGDGSMTRHGIEEYVTDCVLVLDNRVVDQVSTRRLRVVKYRGSSHGANEYPFVIDERGFSVIPVTSLRLDHPASGEFVSTGIGSLDEMLGGGCYRGSTILVTGSAGTGKSTIGAHFVDASCRRGETCLGLLFEESPEQFLRNMRSIGLDLRPWVKRGLLHLHASRPAHVGLEQHLVTMHRLVRELEPAVVLIDPAGNLDPVGSSGQLAEHRLRQLDFLKSKGITAVATMLTDFGVEQPQSGISSLADTWIALRSDEVDGELNRTLRVVKSRGQAHSNQIREFLLGADGVRLVDVYLGESGVLTGSARMKQEQQDLAAEIARRAEVETRRTAHAVRQRTTEAEIERLRADLELERAELARFEHVAEASAAARVEERRQLEARRTDGRIGRSEAAPKPRPRALAQAKAGRRG
jgi:circadian clock protein KaiC